MDQTEIDIRLQDVLKKSKEGERKVAEAKVSARDAALADLPKIVNKIERAADHGQNEIVVEYSVPEDITGRAVREYISTYERAVREQIFRTPGFSGCSGNTCCDRQQSFGIKWE